MNYTESLLWLALWPIVIYAGYRFVRLNLKAFEHFEKQRAQK